MNRRQLLKTAAATAAISLLSPFSLSVFAVDPTDLPVSVTRNDGSVVRGKITSYDRDKVTLDVITKPKDQPVSTDIPWDNIKRVSNGLTREKGLQKWKGEHHDSLCPTCHGNGTIFCPTCHGTHHDPAASTDCPTCKGAGQVACTTAKCDHGTIPCPNPNCLKLSDSGWYKKPDGTRWKKFTVAGGYVEWSEHHVGQVVQKINGGWQNNGICPVCGGVTTISDPLCRGTSEMPCPKCSKNSKTPPCPAHCKDGLVECDICNGTGLKP